MFKASELIHFSRVAVAYDYYKIYGMQLLVYITNYSSPWSSAEKFLYHKTQNPDH